MTTFYDKNHLSQLPSILDWKAIKSKYWGGSENLIEKRKKQAEFLVKQSIPPQLLYGFVCFNKEARKKLMSFGVEENKIKIAFNAYFK